MPRHPAANPILTSAVSQAVSEDHELIERTRRLAHAAVARAEYFLANGSPKMQIDIIRSIMPAIGRNMGARSESEELQEMREKLIELQVQNLGILPDADVIPLHEPPTAT